MSIQQKAFVIRVHPDRINGLDELNVQLGRGWRVVETTPLGGAGAGDASAPCLAALVVAERHEDQVATGEMAAQTEEEAEKAVEDIVEGESLSSQVLSEEVEEERNGGAL